MGAPGAFEYRRQELMELQLPCEDSDVVESFLCEWNCHLCDRCDEFYSLTVLPVAQLLFDLEEIC